VESGSKIRSERGENGGDGQLPSDGVLAEEVSSSSGG
jgi:hypothetical protein